MPPSIPGPVSGVPARKIGLARRSIRGRVTVHGRSIAYESALERDNLLLLSSALAISGWPDGAMGGEAGGALG